MRPLDRYLRPNERVLFRTRLHPMIFGGAVFGAAAVLGIVALIVRRNPLSPGTVHQLWLVGVVVALSSFVSPLVRFRRAELAVTSERLLLRTGFLRVRTVEVPLGEVEDIELDSSTLGRLLGYATVGVNEVGGASEVVGRVARANAFRQAALRAAPASVRRRAGG